MRLAPLVFVLLAACSGLPTEKRISYATVQSLNPGVDGEWILSEYPQARGVQRRPDGRLQLMQYGVDDPQGHSQRLTLYFDEFGVLARKEYSGPLIKPLDPDRQAGRSITAQPR